MRIFKILIADLLFYIGHKLVLLSALTMGYKDTVEELKNSHAHWLKTKAFRRR